MKRLLLFCTVAGLLVACDEHPTAPDTDPLVAYGVPGAPEAPGAPPGMGHGPPRPVVVDFESPALTGWEKLIVPEFTDEASGIRFAPIPIGGWTDVVTGLTPNELTSACVPGDRRDQVLGTGRGESLGFSGFAIRAEFPRPLLKGTLVSAEFQALMGAPVRLTLQDVEGNVVAVSEGAVDEYRGSCVVGRPGGGTVTLTAEAPERVTAAVFEQLSNYVYVIDDVTLDPNRGRN
jgi:hypothetical protein